MPLRTVFANPVTIYFYLLQPFNFDVLSWLCVTMVSWVVTQIEDPSSQAQIRAAEKLTSQENSGRPKEPEQETTAQIDEEEEEDEEVCS